MPSAVFNKEVGMNFLANYTPNPIAFVAFGMPIMWYGIFIAVGMIIATLLTYKRAKFYSIDPDKVLDFVIICIPVGVIGARLYYVAFNWSYYSQDIMKIINIRQGGLAIHGGLLFGILAALIICRINNIHPGKALDLASPGIVIAQGIGRWGNYFNGEAHGGPTDLPWGILVDGTMVHPTFLYESIWCIALGIFLLVIERRPGFVGQIFLIYGILYSVERFFVEALRTDSLLFMGLKQAQIFSLSIIIIFVILYIIFKRRSINNKRLRFRP